MTNTEDLTISDHELKVKIIKTLNKRDGVKYSGFYKMSTVMKQI